jgi:rubrerythrin
MENKFMLKPSWNQKKIFKCVLCGHIFYTISLLFSPKCPKCGSKKTKEDCRVSY